MALIFPTLAERAIAAVGHTSATSLTAVAKSMNAERSDKWPSIIVWTFDDDTSVEVHGRGRNYQLEAHLP